ncbi:protein MTSS 1-like [Sphaeramia orbicularis]|uniref:protein MTSS 1-like n=1 Tax=Sphaeramia orbicularis TaxID=375764 RepID=UPI00117FDF93|nr:protein MTSS 1-like [Sphaeramia orbicularis]
MCMRHRSIEAKLRHFSMVFQDCLISPLQEQMEEWKRVSSALDKDHAKEYKKARQDIKKRSSDTLKLQKKAKKADMFGRGDLQPQLDSAMQDVSDKYLLLEETEKVAVRKALVEERSRFCCFVSMMKPVVEEEMTLLGEITHLQTLTEDLKTLTMDPHKLPPSSEQVIVDLKGSDCAWSYQTPPSSPSTTVSRKSSMCSSLNSVNSSDSRSSGSHCHSPGSSHFRYCASSSSSSSAPPQHTPPRLSSVSSHDSGFTSQDAFQSKSPSPMPPEVLQEDQDPHEDLVRALTRGLQLDLHGSSRDSVQGSSGYNSQTNTPCCSEDAITAQVSDCDYFSVGSEQDSDHHLHHHHHLHHQFSSDYDKSSTTPRNSDITQSYRRMFPSKRPTPAAGPPSNSSAAVTPGVATIRRTPSSKPHLRRPSGGVGLGPIPIKPPMIPVKTPTVPELLGGGGGGAGGGGFPGRAASEDCAAPRSPLSLMTVPLSPLSGSWEGQQGEGPDPPTPPPPQPSGRASERERRPLPELLEEVEYGEAEDYLVTIRRGVKLKKTATDDRSAPSIH